MYSGLTQNYEKTNRKVRKVHKEIRASESFCVSPSIVSLIANAAINIKENIPDFVKHSRILGSKFSQVVD
ncbi:hypothetical protein A6S26_07800 [Nostoc sp. ATCC 43529]|nr:hypothetical protein A6S26_07800 [Nostoc sp. ATCC 43529]